VDVPSVEDGADEQRFVRRSSHGLTLSKFQSVRRPYTECEGLTRVLTSASSGHTQITRVFPCTMTPPLWVQGRVVRWPHSRHRTCIELTCPAKHSLHSRLTARASSGSSITGCLAPRTSLGQLGEAWTREGWRPVPYQVMSSACTRAHAMFWAQKNDPEALPRRGGQKGTKKGPLTPPFARSERTEGWLAELLADGSVLLLRQRSM
jgi:hypothetical protein